MNVFNQSICRVFAVIACVSALTGFNTAHAVNDTYTSTNFGDVTSDPTQEQYFHASNVNNKPLHIMRLIWSDTLNGQYPYDTNAGGATTAQVDAWLEANPEWRWATDAEIESYREFLKETPVADRSELAETLNNGFSPTAGVWIFATKLSVPIEGNSVRIFKIKANGGIDNWKTINENMSQVLYAPLLVSEDSDSDGKFDHEDAFVNDANASVDFDGDGLPDSCVNDDCGDSLVLDTDDDNDGVADGDDSEPTDSTLGWAINAMVSPTEAQARDLGGDISAWLTDSLAGSSALVMTLNDADVLDSPDGMPAGGVTKGQINTWLAANSGWRFATLTELQSYYDYVRQDLANFEGLNGSDYSPGDNTLWQVMTVATPQDPTHSKPVYRFTVNSDATVSGIQYLSYGEFKSSKSVALLVRDFQDTDNDDIENDVDSDDDNDGVNDTLDAFPLMAAISQDLDFDGIADRFNASCDSDCQVASGISLDNDLAVISDPANGQYWEHTDFTGKHLHFARLPWADTLGDLHESGASTIQVNNWLAANSHWRWATNAELTAYREYFNGVSNQQRQQLFLTLNEEYSPADNVTWFIATEVVNSEPLRFDRFLFKSNNDTGDIENNLNINMSGGKVAALLVREVVDTDGDSTPDYLDSDDDNDGVDDVADAFRLNNEASVDTDNDGMPDSCIDDQCGTLTLDTDDDNDGVLDDTDAFPLQASASADNDGDNLPDSYNDGCDQSCIDSDGLTLDNDDDNDNVVDTSDAFPTNDAASIDMDNDGKPDMFHLNCDSGCQTASELILDDNIELTVTGETVSFHLGSSDANYWEYQADNGNHYQFMRLQDADSIGVTPPVSASTAEVNAWLASNTEWRWAKVDELVLYRDFFKNMTSDAAVRANLFLQLNKAWSPDTSGLVQSWVIATQTEATQNSHANPVQKFKIKDNGAIEGYGYANKNVSDALFGSLLVKDLRDTDGDGTANYLDTDDDGDGYSDSDEMANQTDSLDASQFPADSDGDFISDLNDTDNDNDGVDDVSDDFPTQAAASLDTDSDGLPDSFTTSCDASCQTDSGLSLDSDDDNDGTADVDDSHTTDNTQGWTSSPMSAPSDSGIHGDDLDYQEVSIASQTTLVMNLASADVLDVAADELFPGGVSKGQIKTWTEDSANSGWAYATVAQFHAYYDYLKAVPSDTETRMVELYGNNLPDTVIRVQIANKDEQIGGSQPVRYFEYTKDSGLTGIQYSKYSTFENSNFTVIGLLMRTFVDTDGDGVEDGDDAFPADANASLDFDIDGLPDSCVNDDCGDSLVLDTDDDNDGVLDDVDTQDNDNTQGWTSSPLSTQSESGIHGDNLGYQKVSIASQTTLVMNLASADILDVTAEELFPGGVSKGQIKTWTEDSANSGWDYATLEQLQSYYDYLKADPSQTESRMAELYGDDFSELADNAVVRIQIVTAKQADGDAQPVYQFEYSKSGGLTGIQYEGISYFRYANPSAIALLMRTFIDADGDGVEDGDDAFVDDANAAVDSDNDGRPDSCFNNDCGTLILDNDDDDDGEVDVEDTASTDNTSGWSTTAMVLESEATEQSDVNGIQYWKFTNLVNGPGYVMSLPSADVLDSPDGMSEEEGVNKGQIETWFNANPGWRYATLEEMQAYYEFVKADATHFEKLNGNDFSPGNANLWYIMTVADAKSGTDDNTMKYRFSYNSDNTVSGIEYKGWAQFKAKTAVALLVKDFIDSDNDGVDDGLDKFSADANAAVDTDNDGRPDSCFNNDCGTLILDNDDDDDGEVDVEDTAPTDNTSGWSTTAMVLESEATEQSDVNGIQYWKFTNLANGPGYVMSLPSADVLDSPDGMSEEEGVNKGQIETWFNANPGWRYATLKELQAYYEFVKADTTHFEKLNGNDFSPGNANLWYVMTVADAKPGTDDNAMKYRFSYNNDNTVSGIEYKGWAQFKAKTAVALLVKDFIDTDNDGVENPDDLDDDNDGIDDVNDAFPLDERFSKDLDRDGKPDSFTDKCNAACQLNSEIALDDTLTVISDETNGQYWAHTNFAGKHLHIMRLDWADTLGGAHLGGASTQQINEWLVANPSWRWAISAELTAYRGFLFEVNGDQRQQRFLALNNSFSPEEPTLWNMGIKTVSQTEDNETPHANPIMRILIKANNEVTEPIYQNMNMKSQKYAPLLVRDVTDDDTDGDGIIDVKDDEPYDHFNRQGVMDIRDVLGATHMNGMYNFTTKPILTEGADVLRTMGSSAIKIWYGKDFRKNFIQNHNWTDEDQPTSLVELAETDTFKALFSSPDFTSYSLELSTFNNHAGWNDGLNEAEAINIYDEVYAFASYLLQTYQGTGKFFILQNWEGDNNLGQNASKDKVDGMVDWLNTRQRAITDARNDNNVENVWVLGAAECNKVGQEDWVGPRMITDVFPSLNMDLYSYSNWYTQDSEEALLDDLNRIKQYAPDSQLFGNENVMLGEFGNKRLRDGGSNPDGKKRDEDYNRLVSEIEQEIGFDVGSRFSFFWLVYDSNRTKSHALVMDREIQEWMVPEAGLDGTGVDASGRYFSKTHDYLKDDALRYTLIEDQAHDLSLLNGQLNIQLESRDKHDQWDGDPSRLSPTKAQAEMIYYHPEGFDRVAFQLYETLDSASSYVILVSHTGEADSYEAIDSRLVMGSEVTSRQDEQGTGWQRLLVKNTQPLNNPRFVMFRIKNGSAETVQVSASRLYVKQRRNTKHVQFGGDASLITNDDYQQQMNNHEIVQWNGHDSWGNTTNSAVGTSPQTDNNGKPSAEGTDILKPQCDEGQYNDLKLPDDADCYLPGVARGAIYGSLVDAEVGGNLTALSAQLSLEVSAISGDDMPTTLMVDSNTLGITDGKLDGSKNQGISLQFNQDVYLSHVVTQQATGAQFTVALNGQTLAASDYQTSAADWDTQLTVIKLNRPTVLIAGQSVSVAATSGNVSLYSINVISDYVSDVDNDGIPDLEDAFPDDASASVDTDGDDLPDTFNIDCDEACQANSQLTVDSDDDNDNVSDNQDAFPLLIAASADTDGDGMPDAFNVDCDETCQANSQLTVDSDDDNDGYFDDEDNFPTDNTQWGTNPFGTVTSDSTNTLYWETNNLAGSPAQIIRLSYADILDKGDGYNNNGGVNRAEITEWLDSSEGWRFATLAEMRSYRDYLASLDTSELKTNFLVQNQSFSPGDDSLWIITTVAEQRGDDGKPAHRFVVTADSVDMVEYVGYGEFKTAKAAAMLVRSLADTDSDNIADYLDSDDDGDGVDDIIDAFPLDKAFSADVDEDGKPDSYNANCDKACQEQATLVLDNIVLSLEVKYTRPIYVGSGSEFVLDATLSSASDGQPVTYLWQKLDSNNEWQDLSDAAVITEQALVSTQSVQELDYRLTISSRGESESVNILVKVVAFTQLTEGTTATIGEHYWAVEGFAGGHKELMRLGFADTLGDAYEDASIEQVNTWLSTSNGWRWATEAELVAYGDYFKAFTGIERQNQWFALNGGYSPDNVNNWNVATIATQQNEDDASPMSRLIVKSNNEIVDVTYIESLNTNASSVAPLLVRDLVDTDGDGIFDYADAMPNDFDNDGSNDDVDDFPQNSSAVLDTDSDGKPDNFLSSCDATCTANSGLELDLDDDNDGYTDLDELDNGTDTKSGDSTPTDNDGDLISDLNDNDDDNDGVLDDQDAFPFDETAFDSSDADSDGWPAQSGQDPDDNDASVPSITYVDTDGDGLADNGGGNPDDDDDNDGVKDVDDAFPLTLAASLDTDGDGEADEYLPNCDEACIASSGIALDNDDDDDGYSDSDEIDNGTDGRDTEDTPLDSDGDFVSNLNDSDDDNDGVEDSLDAFPLTAAVTTDTDGDGLPDAFLESCDEACIAESVLELDADDDNDGYLDDEDAFPLDATRYRERFVLGDVTNDIDNTMYWQTEQLVDSAAHVMRLPYADRLDMDADHNNGGGVNKGEVADWLADNVGWRYATLEELQAYYDYLTDLGGNDRQSRFIDLNGDYSPGDNSMWIITTVASAQNESDSKPAYRFEFNDNNDVTDIEYVGYAEFKNAKAAALLVRPLIDTDGDGEYDYLDTDIDGDGVENDIDAFPLNSAASVDEDADGLPDVFNADCDNECQLASGLQLDLQVLTINVKFTRPLFVAGGAEFVLDATASNASDGSDVSYQWSEQNSAGEWQVISDTSVSTGIAPASTEAVQTLSYQLTVSASSEIETALVDVKVVADTSPVEGTTNDPEQPIYWVVDEFNGTSMEIMRLNYADTLGTGAALTTEEVNFWLALSPGWRWATQQELEAYREYWRGMSGDERQNQWFALNGGYSPGNVNNWQVVTIAEPQAEGDLAPMWRSTIKSNNEVGAVSYVASLDVSSASVAPLLVRDQTDTDGDGVFDYEDMMPNDFDNDGSNDDVDDFPQNSAAILDTDSDGKPDNFLSDCDATCVANSGLELDFDDDNDGYTDLDELDNGTDTQSGDSTPTDNDGDSISDLNDNDDDNDGVLDEQDAFPFDDTAFELSDADNDGWPAQSGQDPDDNDASVPSMTYVDTDGDGLADNGGGNPDDDDDNDGVKDVDDAFPLTLAASLDTDGDGEADEYFSNCDEACIASSGIALDNDDDNDGYSDSDEIDNATDGRDAEDTPLDSDGDFVSNFNDSDDDNDGVEDSLDAFPLNAAATTDTDGDGLPDVFLESCNEACIAESGLVLDLDDDNDGYLDVDDVFPTDVSQWRQRYELGAVTNDINNEVYWQTEQLVDSAAHIMRLDYADLLDKDAGHNNGGGVNKGDINTWLAANPGWRYASLEEMYAYYDYVTELVGNARQTRFIGLNSRYSPADESSWIITTTAPAKEEGDSKPVYRFEFSDTNEVTEIVYAGYGEFKSARAAALLIRPLIDSDLDGRFDYEDSDIDGDGVDNELDAFPLNNAASVDEDQDGKPDSFNPTCDDSCQQSSGLVLDDQVIWVQAKFVRPIYVSGATEFVMDASTSTVSNGDTLSYQWRQQDAEGVWQVLSQEVTLTAISPDTSDAVQVLEYELTVSTGDVSDSVIIQIKVAAEVEATEGATNDVTNSQSWILDELNGIPVDILRLSYVDTLGTDQQASIDDINQWLSTATHWRWATTEELAAYGDYFRGIAASERQSQWFAINGGYSPANVNNWHVATLTDAENEEHASPMSRIIVKSNNEVTAVSYVASLNTSATSTAALIVRDRTDSDNDGLFDYQDERPFDADNDGYTDDDETAAESDPLSASSIPADFDNDFISDVTDNDDDNDLVEDALDQFPFNSAASIDVDNDGKPEVFNPDCDADCIAASGLEQDTDGFESAFAVPTDIVIEATAAEMEITEAQLGEPTMFALLSKTPLLAASYTLGVHQIEWQAVGADGQVFEQVQQLTIQDTVAPEFVREPLLAIDAVGPLTLLSPDLIGEVMVSDAVDGEFMAIVEGDTLLPVGSHEVTWVAQDSSGNSVTLTELITIRPQINMDSEQWLTLSELSDNSVQSSVHLLGVAPSYPLNVDIEVALSSGDSVLRDTMSLVIIDDTRLQHDFSYTLPTSVVIDANTELTFTVITASDAVVGTQSKQKVRFVDTNVAPVLDIAVQQDSVMTQVVDRSQAAEITISLAIDDVNQSDTHTVTWQTPSALVDQQIDDLVTTFELDPSTLSVGQHTVTATVSDNGSPSLQSDISLQFTVVDNFVFSVDTDSDNDGILDSDEGLTDSDGDGIPDYLDSLDDVTVLPLGEGTTQLMQTEVGLKLKVGETIISNDATAVKNATIDITQIVNNASNRNNAGEPIEPFRYNVISDVVDFEISGLPIVGSVGNVVLPLPDGEVLSGSAEYVKYDTTEGIVPFVIDDNNQIFSAPLVLGQCPGVLSEIYQLGLNAGDSCVRLSIEDGGPNDSDGLANGVIADPGFISEYVTNLAPIPDLQVQTDSYVELSTIQLSAAASFDFDDDELTYQWQLIGESFTQLIGSERDIEFVLPEVMADTLVSIHLTVDDGELATSVTQAITIEHMPSQVQAIITTSDVDPSGLLFAGDRIVLSAAESAANKGELTFIWDSSLDDDSGFSDALGTQTYFIVPALDSDQSITFTLEVNNGIGDVTSVSTVTVTKTIKAQGTARQELIASKPKGGSFNLYSLLLLVLWGAYQRRQNIRNLYSRHTR